MNTESQADEKVTCRKCRHTYVPDLANDFYPDGEDPKVGLCEHCKMREAFGMNDKRPHSLPEGHLGTVCKSGQGAATCCFIIFGDAGYQCAKDSCYEKNIRDRLAAGTMEARGDNCSGAPSFTPTPS